MKSTTWTVLELALLAGLSPLATAAEPLAVPAANQRETVLDRKVHIEEQIQELPPVPPLCDALKVETRRINVGGCELYCETEGRGMPIVLINCGPGGTHHDFHPYFGPAALFAQVDWGDLQGPVSAPGQARL